MAWTWSYTINYHGKYITDQWPDIFNFFRTNRLFMTNGTIIILINKHDKGTLLIK